jgi:hypothetical protein
VVPRTPRVHRVAAVLAAVALLLGAARLVQCVRDHANGLEVRVHNADTHTLHAVTVSVTGHSYDLGDLPPGATGAVTVAPTSESSVAISLTDGTGRRRELGGFGYIEPDSSGWQLFDVTEAGVHKVKEHQEPY